MADVDFDEDEFADLYDDAPAAQPEPTQASTATLHAEPEPQAEAAPVEEAPQVSADAHVDYNNGNEEYDDGNGMQDNYNEGYGGDEDMRVEADHDAPIGIKEDGKMFIGGLNWETTDESLKDYFTQFGRVLECTVMRDSATGRSRGFGFLTFEDPKVVNTVMVKEHYLDGKIIDPKRAIPREEQERTSKIFVGGVHHAATEDQFREFFRQFGRVIDATLMMDKDTGHPRGFGFVTFDGEDAVERALSRPLAILDKPIEVKKAEPRGGAHHDDQRGNKFGNRKFDKFNRDGGQGDMNGHQGQNQMAGPNGQNMSPSEMAKFWFAMQNYFSQMQQRLAMQMQGGQPGMGMANPMMAMGGQMNPAMMQQMQQMMAARMQGGQSPGMQGMPQGMDPNMMQQMMQQQQQMMAAQQQQGGGNAAQGMGQGFNGSDQNGFEQQKFERQQARMAQQNFAAQQHSFAQGAPTSWEGMYDDVPPPSAPPSGPRGGGAGGAGPMRQHNRGGAAVGAGPVKQHSQTPPTGPSNAPINAPTGPKNAGKPGANFRPGVHGGGGRGRGGGRYNPY